jgi:4-amino-4-deoxy-L-arabinose transferase-like glycosyltransferase
LNADSKELRQAWGIAAAFALFRLWYVSRIQLSADEAYYWEWSRHLALSYYDQGPMLALAIRLGTTLFGSNELGVRFMSVLCGLLSSGLAIDACRLLKRPQAAPWLTVALNGMLLFGVGAVLMMHDSLMGFFWMLALYAALRGVTEKKQAWWILFGLATACAILSKYTGLLILGCLFLALSSHDALREELRKPALWLGVFLALVLGLTPILIWNAANAWPSFIHVFSLAGADPSRRSFSTFPEFLGSQLGLVTPILCFLVLRAWWHGRHGSEMPSTLERRGGSRWLLWCFGAPVFLFFCFLSLRTRVEGNWPAQAYLAGLLLCALDLDWKGPLARWALGLTLGFSALAFSQAAWPFLPIPQEHAKLDTASRLDGWRELAAGVESRLAGLKAGSFVGCRTYQNAAELAFYLPGQPHPLIVQKGQINHEYRFWNQPELYKGQDAVLVVGQDWEADEMRERFKHFEDAGTFEVWRHGIVTQKFHFFLGRDFSG